MCEFCLKHGEGEKWYLQAKNYSDDLLSDVRRRKFIEEFAGPREMDEALEGLDRLNRAPGFIRTILSRLLTRKMKKVHFGQVIPIEDVERIFGFTNSIARVACICRHATLGKEKRYCYGVSLSPEGGLIGEILGLADKSFFGGPHAPEAERLSREEAISAFHSHEQEGLCHTVWTFHTPFIGGICNCDRSDCLAMRYTVTHSTPVMFRAEYVAGIDFDLCSGCRECMRVCQFGAVSYSASNKKAVIDQMGCYGCGVCRSVCEWDAIRLQDRSSAPITANLW